MTAYETFTTPIGDFTVLVDESGALAAAAFGGLDSLPRMPGSESAVLDPQRTAPVRQQVEEYFRGERREFDLPLAPAGSEFQKAYRRAMAGLTYGQLTTYGALARELDTSARAAGRANATNPLCLIVPCHRVIGSDGTLTGYAYGIDVKRRLLEHEGALVPQPTLV